MTYELTQLKFEFDGLEPTMNKDTIETHYTKHHQGYLNKFKAAIEGTDLDGKDIVEILSDLSQIPAEIKGAVVNNGGGFYNHNIWWESLVAGGSDASEELIAAINETFGSIDELKEKLGNAAKTQFGSGWGWLVLDKASKKLEVIQTGNQDCPLSIGKVPLLAIDVWEHAYYLKYKNLRPNFVDDLWSIVDWAEVSKKYSDALDA